jgi:transglutaminase-like putative cysteine protease
MYMLRTSIHPETIAWLIISLALVTAPHLVRLPLWIPLIALVFGLWRWLAAKRRLPLPGGLLRVLLMTAIPIGIFLSYGRVFGREAGTAWLIALIALKLIELRTHRDAIIVVLLAYFLVITQFLFSQSIPTALYMLLVITIITSTLIAINYMSRKPPPLTERLRLSLTLLAQAAPVMLLLFVLFPRVPGPLWSLPADAHGGRTGLNEEMMPGSISDLIQSAETAFRVEFSDPVPPEGQRYWRGPVLWHFDGRRWRSGYGRYRLPPEDFTPLGTPVRYSVTLEPHNRRWLFALELPDTLPAGATLTSDYRLLANIPVRKRQRYTLTSYPDFQVGKLLSASARRAALQLPESGIERSRALASEWRDASAGDRDIVGRALQLFNEQPFVYTLQPPLLGNRPVDEFLFETRRGFCEHYASAFTLLMRAAGIPARVVTGYLGGELNPIDGFYTVRQSDAHAWAEVWYAGQGWVRVDPTGAVAPQRIEQGIGGAVPGTDPLPGFIRTNSTLLKQFRYTLEAINNGWNQWVIAYGERTQRELLARLGIGLDSWKGMAIGLLVSISVMLVLLAAALLWRQAGRQVLTPEVRLYRRFCEHLARLGIHRRAGEGPVDFARRAGALRPEAARAIRDITTLFIAIRYGNERTAQRLSEFRQAVQAFSPGHWRMPPLASWWPRAG